MTKDFNREDAGEYKTTPHQYHYEGCVYDDVMSAFSQHQPMIHKVDSWQQKYQEQEAIIQSLMHEKRTNLQRITLLQEKNDYLREQLELFAGQHHSTRNIPRLVWRFLIQLAHPDRHNNTPESNEVTRWLLDNKPPS